MIGRPCALQPSGKQEGRRPVRSRHRLGRREQSDTARGARIQADMPADREKGIGREGHLVQRRGQQETVVLRLELFLLFLRTPVAVVRQRQVHMVAVERVTGLDGADQVPPAHPLVRPVRSQERVAVHAPQHESRDLVPLIEAPGELAIRIEHEGAESVQVTQTALHQALERLVLCRQRGDSRSGEHGALLADRRGYAGPRQEVVQRGIDFPGRARVRRGGVQRNVRRTEITLRTSEATLDETRGLNHVRRQNGGNAQHVRIAIDGNPVHGQQVAAAVAAADIEGGRAVRARRHAGERLHPAQRVALAQRRGRRPDVLRRRQRRARLPLHPPQRRDPRRLQGVAKLDLLGGEGQGGK